MQMFQNPSFKRRASSTNSSLGTSGRLAIRRTSTNNSVGFDETADEGGDRDGSGSPCGGMSRKDSSRGSSLWRMHTDHQSGRRYYSDSLTGETSWHLPSNAQLEPNLDDGAVHEEGEEDGEDGEEQGWEGGEERDGEGGEEDSDRA